jgi:hypothetical protein
MLMRAPSSAAAARPAGDLTITIPVKLDGHEVTRVVARLLPSELRKMGAM